MSLPLKPYYIRALYEWCADNGYTPHLAVWVNEHTRVPAQFVKDQEIILNISANATQNLLIDNEWISFQARFGGISQDILIPVGHVIGIFAKETGEGMGFAAEAWQPESSQTEADAHNNTVAGDSSTDGSRPKKGPRLVK